MAMKPCRECGKDVSTSAKNCPHCGKPSPTQATVSTGTGCLIIVALLIVFGYMMGGTGSAGGGGSTQLSEHDRALGAIFAAKDAVKGVLKDPESARFGEVAAYHMNNGFVACGTVNSRNSFGGYTGQKRFVSGGTTEATFLSESMTATEFAKLWNQACVGSSVASTRAD